MFVSSRIRIYRRSGYKFSRLSASSGRGAVSGKLSIQVSNSRSHSAAERTGVFASLRIGTRLPLPASGSRRSVPSPFRRSVQRVAVAEPPVDYLERLRALLPIDRQDLVPACDRAVEERATV